MCEKHLAHCPVLLSTLYVFMLTSKNSHNLKVERFYLVAIFRTSNPRDSISSNLERTASRRWGEEPGYIEALQQRAGSLNIKIINWNQISQEIECFSVCRKMQESGLTEASPIICTSAILGQYPVCFSHFGPVGAHGEEWLPSWWLLDRRHFFLRALRTQPTLGDCSHWCVWHPCLLTQQEKNLSCFNFSRIIYHTQKPSKLKLLPNGC